MVSSDSKTFQHICQVLYTLRERERVAHLCGAWGSHFETCNLHLPSVFAGIPVKSFPDNEEIIKPVQYAALFTDLVKHTRFALKSLEIND